MIPSSFTWTRSRIFSFFPVTVRAALFADDAIASASARPFRWLRWCDSIPRLRRKCRRGFGARVSRHEPALSSSVSAAGLGPPMPSGRRWEFGHGAGSDARRRTRPPQGISATSFGLGATDDVPLSRGGSGLQVQLSLHHVSERIIFYHLFGRTKWRLCFYCRSYR